MNMIQWSSKRGGVLQKVLRKKLPPWANEAVLNTILCEGNLGREKYRLEQMEQGYKAEADVPLAKREKDRADLQVREAREKYTHLKPGRWLIALLNLVPGLLSFPIEYVFSITTLPFLFDLAPSTLEGKALALIPVVCIVILHLILLRLVEGPWQHTPENSSGESHTRSRVPKVVMVLFLLVLGLAQGYMLYLVSEGRDEAMALKSLFNGANLAQTVTLNHDLLKQMVITLTMVIALTGAMLLVVGMEEWQRCWGRWLAKRRLIKYLRLQRQAETALATAEVQVRVWQERKNRLEWEVDQAGHFLCSLLYLQYLHATSRHKSSMWDMVNEGLKWPITTQGAPPPPDPGVGSLGMNNGKLRRLPPFRENAK